MGFVKKNDDEFFGMGYGIWDSGEGKGRGGEGRGGEEMRDTKLTLATTQKRSEIPAQRAQVDGKSWKRGGYSPLTSKAATPRMRIESTGITARQVCGRKDVRNEMRS